MTAYLAPRGDWAMCCGFGVKSRGIEKFVPYSLGVGGRQFLSRATESPRTFHPKARHISQSPRSALGVGLEKPGKPGKREKPVCRGKASKLPEMLTSMCHVPLPLPLPLPIHIHCSPPSKRKASENRGSTPTSSCLLSCLPSAVMVQCDRALGCNARGATVAHGKKSATTASHRFFRPRACLRRKTAAHCAVAVLGSHAGRQAGTQHSPVSPKPKP